MIPITLLLVLLISTTGATRANQVVLMDSTMEKSLDWTTYPFGPQQPTPGWVEESYTDFEKGINWRAYVVCDVAYNNVNNWLWTPFIERGPAKSIFIEIKFSMRDCSLFPGKALSCKETFSLLHYEFDAATKEPPPWQPESYKLIDRIAADEGRFTASSQVIINTEVRSVPVNKKGVYFAFRDQGACISLLAVKVYYLSCPEVTSGYARLPATPTGPDLTSIQKVVGTCVENAREIDRPWYLCKGDGNWYPLSGGCACKPGYTADPGNQTCNPCPPGRFKPDIGDDSCRPCPPYSSASESATSMCHCDNGYYRAPNDPPHMHCSRPPSAPLNLTVNFVDQGTVILSWKPPRDLGGRIDVSYRVACDKCHPHVTYSHPQGRSNDTVARISGLNPVSTYRFLVYAENGVSDQAGPASYADITVTTEATVPWTVGNVRILDVKPTQVTIRWDSPKNHLADIEEFKARYFQRGYMLNSTSVVTKGEETTFSNLQHSTEYGFQVRAKTKHGWGEFTKPIYTTTGHTLAYMEEENEVPQVRIIAGATVAVVILLGIVVFMAVLFFRSRSSEDCNKKQPSDCDALEYRNGEVHCNMEAPPIVPTHTTQVFKSYVDPHTYEDPNQAVKEFAREIDASCITIEAIIGGGEFGDVCRGKLSFPGRTETLVAIKTLKPGSSDKAKRDFLTEASIMGQFEHPNVIFLQGVVTKSNPIMIITEYMENGSLDTFLRANDGKLEVIQLMGMLRGIAAGMQYLSEMNYIHRDLAARNVLVNQQLICKIADFGLSREIESATEGAYTTRGGKIPVRWTAPEAIAYRKFTSASDVWSFGVAAWEVMSYGERPYWNWSNQEVIKAIEKGYRLPAPMDCPEAIHQLMLDCWQKDRTHRPTFATIVRTLDKLIRCPELLRKVANNSFQNPLAPDAPDLTHFNSVAEWLGSIKMTRYLENFDRSNLTDMSAVMKMNLQELSQMGITLAGHQKKIMNSVQAMRLQVSAELSEGVGYLV